MTTMISGCLVRGWATRWHRGVMKGGNLLAFRGQSSFATSHKLTGKPWPLTVASKNLIRDIHSLKAISYKNGKRKPDPRARHLPGNEGKGVLLVGGLRNLWLRYWIGRWRRFGWGDAR